ncbi:uncharacterized protein LOC110841184 [Zootermopsis nevadensis]|uniref:uncharacterized protein LOC110841184 n=1 Tax=Zootermopsis nevadensis TaxID=136037 RepID=UPI000B8EBC2C|nr:uncharacterized protein LOC110841184 [Zootermopsis nevadensis]
MAGSRDGRSCVLETQTSTKRIKLEPPDSGKCYENSIFTPGSELEKSCQVNWIVQLNANRGYISPTRLRPDNELNAYPDTKAGRVGQTQEVGHLHQLWYGHTVPLSTTLHQPATTHSPSPQHVALNQLAGVREETRSSPSLLSSCLESSALENEGYRPAIL